MLSEDKNRLLTRVGPDTRMGQYLHCIAIPSFPRSRWLGWRPTP